MYYNHRSRHINSSPSNFLSITFVSGIIIVPSIENAIIYVAVFPWYSSVFNATMIVSSDPGKNLKLEKPLTGISSPISLTYKLNLFFKRMYYNLTIKIYLNII